MTFHNIDNVKLEIEVPTDGLPNLIQNPSGLLGAWAWLTPVANTVMNASTSPYLEFKTTVAQAAYFTSQSLKVSAGQYVAARFDTVSATTSHNVKCQFVFYNSAGTVISSSSQTGAFGTGAATQYVPAVVAPAGTTSVRLRYDMYNGGTGTALANAYYRIKNVMVTYAATSSFQSQRTNLVRNPGVETNINGWIAAGASTVTRSTSVFKSGVASVQVAKNSAASDGMYVSTPFGNDPNTYKIPVVGGRTYAFAFEVRSAAVSRVVSFELYWLDSSGVTAISQYVGGSGITSTTAWTRLKGTATAPSNAAYATLIIRFRTGSGTNMPTSELHYIDEAIFEVGTSIGTYFDGSFVNGGGLTYGWAGTVHNSTSTETSTSYAFSQPNDWRNIWGPTVSYSCSRGALDVGSITLDIADSLLDPSYTSDVRPGKRVRLTADYDNTGVFRNVWEGKTTKANATYNGKNTLVTLTATDNMDVLSSQAEARGMSALTDLPFILEGRGVPWNVKGSGNQVASAAVVAFNDNASVADQIAITRDSNLGYAWVDRFNTLQVINQSDPRGEATINFTDVPGSLGPTTISPLKDGVDVGFDMDECINEVNVTWQRYTASTAETTEVAYGPYRNQTSIDTYGAKSATFTWQGAAESSSAIATKAQSILTANAIPVRKANSLTFAVKDTNTMYAATVIDLYSNVTVTYSDKLTNAPYVVTSIEHAITPESWTVTLGFGSNTAVASPTVTPSPNAGSTGLDVNTWYTATIISPYTAASPAPKYMKDTAGSVHIRGAVNVNSATNGAACITLPTGFRPTSQVQYTNDTTPAATSSNRVVIASNGNVQPYTKTGTPTVHFLDTIFSSL